MQSLFTDYFILIVYVIANVFFLIKKWEFVKHALSEKGLPSSKRLGAFYLLQGVMICEIFSTTKTHEFRDVHLYAILTTICLCWGIATVPQILEIWKGKSSNTNGINNTDTKTTE